MEPTPPNTNLLVDSSGMVQDNLPCRDCRYNLRGLASDNRCPECGTPVEHSLQRGLLRFADVRWLKTLTRGSRVSSWGVIVGLGLLSFQWLHYLVLAGPVISNVLAFVWAGLNYYGAWLLTVQEPNGLPNKRVTLNRRLVRICFVPSLLQSLLIVPLVFSVITGTLGSSLLLSLMLWLTTLAGEFSRFSYLAYLALRIPSPIDERRACLLRWLSIFLGLLDVLVGILIVFRFQPFSINFPWTASLTPAFVVGGAYALLKVAIAVLHLMLLRRLGIAFRGSANLRELPASSL